MAVENRQFLLAARPQKMVQESDFELHTGVVPGLDPAAGNQVLVRAEYISLDPSMRGQMENRADYVAPLEIGDVMRAGGVGRVVESQHPGFQPDQLVGGSLGMQEYSVCKAGELRPFAAGTEPPRALGALGITGMTAWFGLWELGKPVPGDTVVVSGAAGATGSIAGQIARIMGCRVIGIAGSAEKCSWLTNDLGFHGAINYRTDDLDAALRQHCPDGIDVYFDNVGGEILDRCLARIATGARIVICGGISRYNLGTIPAGPKNYFNLVFRRARMEGFIVTDYADRFPAATKRMQRWFDSGELKDRATIIDGFEHLPRALISLFEGDNMGKMMVKVF